MRNEALAKVNKFVYKVYRLLDNKEIVRILLHIFYAGSGYAMSESIIFLKYAPFGIAMLSSVNDKYIFSTLSGVFFGYLFNASVNIPARYIAALIVVLTIRWTLSNLEKITSHSLYTPLLSFAACFSTGLTITLVSNSIRNAFLMFLAESLICAASTYFFSKFFTAISQKRPIYTFSLEEISGVGFFVSAILLSFKEIELLGLSLSGILFSLFILIAAKLGGISSAAICGVVVSLIQSLSYSGIREISGAFAAAALIAGIFTPVNKIIGGLSFTLALGIFSLEVGRESAFVSQVYEALVASTFFVFLPIESSPEATTPLHSSFDKMLTRRLDSAAEAIGGVCDIVNEISQKLSTMYSSNDQEVFDSAIESTCQSCGLNLYCWGENYDKNISNIYNLIPILKKNAVVLPEDISEFITDKCIRKSEFSENISCKYRDYIAAENAKIRFKALQEVVSGQFSTISYFIKDFSKAMYFDYIEDTSGRLLLEKEFLKFDIEPLDILCVQKKDGEFHITASFDIANNPELEVAVLLSIIGRCYRRKFYGELSCESDTYTLIAHENPKLLIKYAAAQKASFGSDFCGDSYKIFKDCFGNYVCILSDGMGTGGRAAIDGAMASGIMERLVKSGVSFDSALKITNYAMISKSPDESLATLDCASINPYSGETLIYKAGAPMSLLKKDGKIKELFASALPAGIVCDVDFSKIYEKLDVGDMLIMFTDGVVFGESKWLSALIENLRETDAQKIADEILEFAINMRPRDKSDDISVVVLLAVSPDEA